MHRMIALPPPQSKQLLPEARLPMQLLLILAAVSLLAIAAPLLIVANASQVAVVERAVSRARAPQRVIPPAELPPVEPAVFVAVDPKDARAYNASIPFSTAPLLPARPFQVVGAADSIARATDCLTAGVLYEAGDDPTGQRAVAQVILNRVRHPAFPKTVCGVVFQGAERRTGCQFTFTCDGALARRYSAEAWGRAQRIATAALTGAVDRSVGTATHYHTNWVVPYWSSSLDKISEVHTHLFFRWTGWWGTPPAFRGRYLADEPLVAKLKGVAAAHGDAPETTGSAESPIEPALMPTAALPPPVATDPNVFLLTLDPRLSAADYAAFAARVCAERAYCKLLAWTDRADTPAALPGDPRQMQRLAFSYLRDRARGFDKALWACDRFARPEPGQCMKAQLVLPSDARREPAKLETPAGSQKPASGASAVLPELTGVRRSTGTLAPVVPPRPGPVVGSASTVQR